MRVSLPAVAVSGTGRVLAVGISTTDAVTGSSVNYGSQALTSRVARAAHGTRAEIWTLTAPATGTATVQVTLSGEASATVGASLFTGVDQASPVMGANAGDADTGVTSAVAVLNNTSAVDGMLGVLALGNVANTYNVRAGGSTDLVTADVRWNEVGSVRGAGATRRGNTGQNMALTAGVNWRWNRIDPAQKSPYTLAVIGLRAGPVNAAPGADAGGPYGTSGGNGVTLDASGSSDPEGDALTFSWDVDGDATCGDATGVSPTLTWAQLQALGLGDGPATAAVRVRVSDAAESTLSAPATLTIANTAPTATLSNSGDVTEGEAASVSFSGAADPGDAELRFAFDFDADGTYDVGGATYASAVTSDSASVPAALLADGPKTVTVRAAVIDRDNGLTAYTTSIAVANASPSAVPSDVTVSEGTPATLGLTGVSDASAADLAAGIRYAYDFDNDGAWDIGSTKYDQASPLASVDLPAALTADGGVSQTVRAAVVDRDDGRTEYTATVVVSNAPPSASIAGPEAVPSSGEVTLTLGASDPSSSDELTGVLDWGDGRTETVTGSGARTVGHTYAASGDYTVTLVVRDSDGAESAAARHTLAVASLPAPRVNPEPTPEATSVPTATPSAGAVAGVTATQPLRISDLAVTPRCIRAPQLRATVAGVRTLGVRFRVSSATPVRFSLERWKDKPGASACPPARGKAKADGRRIAGVYAAHSKRAVDARAGVNTVMLAATDGNGKRLRPGTYRLTIRSGEASARVKLWALR